MDEWTKSWEYQGKNFIKHTKCGKSMLLEYKDKHVCPTVGDFTKATDVGNLRNVTKDLFEQSMVDILEMVQNRPIEFTTEDIRTMIDTLYMSRARRTYGEKG